MSQAKSEPMSQAKNEPMSYTEEEDVRAPAPFEQFNITLHVDSERKLAMLWLLTNRSCCADVAALLSYYDPFTDSAKWACKTVEDTPSYSVSFTYDEWQELERRVNLITGEEL